MLTEYLAICCFILGAFFLLSGVLGIFRMPDFFAKLHPAGMIDVMAVPLILIGVILLNGWTLLAAKIVILIIFLFITGPTITHIAAKAAYLAKKEAEPLVKIKAPAKPKTKPKTVLKKQNTKNVTRTSKTTKRVKKT